MGDQRGTGLTVGDLLTLPSLEGAAVVAGEGGVHRPVRQVTVVAGTEIVRWVKPGALVIASGFPLQEQNHPPADLIERLRQHDVACLAVRLGSYLPSFPSQLVRAAEALDFPLLRLTDRFAFDEILIDVMSRLNEGLAADLELAEQIHAALADVVVRGGDVAEVAGEVERLIGASVHYVDDARHVIDGELRIDRTADWSPSERRIRDSREAPRPTNRVVLPIGSAESDAGLLVCSRPGASFSTAEIRALERAATVAALALAQLAARREIELGFRSDILGRALRGEISDPDDGKVLFDRLGWANSGPLQVAVAAPTLAGPEEQSAQARWIRLTLVPLIQRRLASDRCAVAVVGVAVVAVVPVDAAQRARQAFEEGLQWATDRFGRGPQAPMCVGVSTTVNGIAGLPDGYREALVAARAARERSASPALMQFGDLGLLGLVTLAAGDRSVVDVAKRTLAPVSELTDHEAQELLTTLRALVDTALHLREAARRIPCHYNTIRNRVQRLQSLLGPFIRDSDLWANIVLSVRILELAERDPDG